MEDIMANVIRYNPVDDAFDDLFRGFLMRPVRMDSSQDVQIKLDVKEDEKSYTVHAEIPGVNKEDIHVSIDGNQVAISAEVKNEKEIKEGEKVLRTERYYGKVSRAFSVAQDLDETLSQAKYNDGVLELMLAKKSVVTSKRLEIN
jgi:HSP20 family protein